MTRTSETSQSPESVAGTASAEETESQQRTGPESGNLQNSGPLSSKAPLLHNDMHEAHHAADKPGRRPGRISRTLLNFWLDTLLAVIFVILSITAVIVQFVFPPGVAARGWLLWGMSYGKWTGIQFALLAILGCGVVLHVMLHWTWVCSVLIKRVLGRSTLPDDGIRTLVGVGLLITLLLTGAVVIGVAQMTIVRPN